MKVLVCGGRDFDNPVVLRWLLDRIAIEYEVLIHGAAKGADSMAGAWGEMNGKRVIAVPADWETYGKSAGPVRNRAMLEMKPDLVIAFPGGRGTAHMCNISEKAGIPVIKLVMQ